MKRCTTCGLKKPLIDFYKHTGHKDNHRSECKVCSGKKNRKWCENHRERVREFQKKYDDNNKEKKAIYMAGYRKKNMDRLGQYSKEYRAKNKERLNQATRDWEKLNPKRAREIRNKAVNKLRMTAKGRLSVNFGNRIRHSLKGNKGGNHWESIVGYSINELKSHIESQFTCGMSWDNYGLWHIDHIIPIAAFSYETFDDTEFKQCWALENLQPLWAVDNLSKGNKLTTLNTKKGDLFCSAL